MGLPAQAVESAAVHQLAWCAIEEAKKLGMSTVGLLGRDGGKLREMCNHSIVVPSQVTARIQECHILIGHTLCGLIEQELGIA